MAIRKDLDDMLNNLKGIPSEPEKPRTELPKLRRKTKFDDMSVDDLLTAIHKEETQSVQVAPSEPPAPEEPHLKASQVVVSEELPDYEAIRHDALEHDRMERERAYAAAEETVRREHEHTASEIFAADPYNKNIDIAEDADAAIAQLDKLMNSRKKGIFSFFKKEEEEPIPPAPKVTVPEEPAFSEPTPAPLEPTYEAPAFNELAAPEPQYEEPVFTEPEPVEPEPQYEYPQFTEPEPAPSAEPVFEEPETAEAPVFEEGPFSTAEEAEYVHPVETTEASEAANDEPAVLSDDTYGESTADDDMTPLTLPESPMQTDFFLGFSDDPYEEEEQTEEAAPPVIDFNETNENVPDGVTQFYEELIVTESYEPRSSGYTGTYPPKSNTSLTVDELMDAAIAAVHEEMNDDEDTDSSSAVNNMLEGIRANAAEAIADIENHSDNTEEGNKPFPTADKEEAPLYTAAPPEPIFPKSRVAAALGQILDEDPEDIINARSEKTEDGPVITADKSKLKKSIYTILGVIFAVLACVGLVTVVSKGIKYFGSFTSGEVKRDGFTDVIYPAVIMDIESFNDPSELTSEQVITATIWSMIMSDDALESYEHTFDVATVPAVDIEAYAVKIFGENIPSLEHKNVGPAEARFYYNEESKSYNIPVKPITFTYSPDIKTVTKNGNEYKLVVDYINELPSWMETASSKQVEYTLIEVNGSYQIHAMKVLSASTSL